MSSRREFMNYIGTAAIGGIGGYYIGAKELLGIQSEDVVRVESAPTKEPRPTEESTLTEEPGPTEEPTPTEGTETSTQQSGRTIYSDEFEDGEVLNQWRYADDENASATTISESDSILYHKAPFSYGGEDNGDLLTQESFNASGRVRLSARIRTLISDYWGYGFSLRFPNGGVTLQNHRWEGFDRFAARGVKDRPDKYASDYDAYGEQTHTAKFAPATTHSDFVEYSMTVDLESGELVRVQRGQQTWDTSLEIGNTSGACTIRIGAGGGHEVEFDYIRLEAI